MSWASGVSDDPPVPILLGMAPAYDENLIVHAVGQSLLKHQRVFIKPTLLTGGVAGISPNVIDLHRPSLGTTRIVECKRELVLKDLGSEGQVLGTQILSVHPMELKNVALLMYSWIHGNCVAVGGRLIIHWHGGQWRT